MNRKTLRIVIGIIVGFLLILELGYFAARRSKLTFTADSGQHLIMGTFARIVAVAGMPGSANKCIEAAFDQLENIEAMMAIVRSSITDRLAWQ